MGAGEETRHKVKVPVVNVCDHFSVLDHSRNVEEEHYNKCVCVW